MSLNASLVIVPDWLDAALANKKWGAEHVLDLFGLSRILSTDDVSFYVAINTFCFEEMHAALKETFGQLNLLDKSKQHLMNEANGQPPRLEDVDLFTKKVGDKVYGSWRVNMTMPDARSMTSVLPYMQQAEEISKDAAEYLFDVYYIKDGVFGVKFKLRDKSRSLSSQLLECYDKLIGTLSTFYTFEQIAMTRAFQEFVTLSRANGDMT